MIYISVGHHQTKPGACYEGFCEFDEAKVWASMITYFMGPHNALVIPNGTLKQKVDFINERNPLAAVEIHFNSLVSGTNAHGCETLHHPNSSKGKRISISLQDTMVTSGLKDRGVKYGYYRMDKSKGVDFFLDKTNCPAVIIEPEFIFNKEMIQSKREETCKNISKSLLEVLKWLKMNT